MAEWAFQRLEYTKIGNTINIASRVESLTKKVGEPILMADATQQALPESFLTEALPPHPVKGQSKPLNIYRVKG